MSRNKKNKIDGGYIIIPKNTLKSPEWKKLTPCARLAFIAMLTEFIRDKKLNPNNELKITHSQIEAIAGIGHSTTVRGMKQLKKQSLYLL